jgi:hypothetical protein
MSERGREASRIGVLGGGRRGGVDPRLDLAQALHEPAAQQGAAVNALLSTRRGIVGERAERRDEDLTEDEETERCECSCHAEDEDGAA